MMSIRGGYSAGFVAVVAGEVAICGGRADTQRTCSASIFSEVISVLASEPLT